MYQLPIGVAVIAFALSACSDAGESVGTVRSAHTGATAGPTKAKIKAVKTVAKQFRSVAQAEAAGYVKLGGGTGIMAKDGSLPCLTSHDGAMGIHYVDLEELARPGLNPLRPELLNYSYRIDDDDDDGDQPKLRLYAVEYIEGYDPANPAPPPSIFGQTLAGPVLIEPGAPFYELHVWAIDNPNGIFSDWNPRVTCGALESYATEVGPCPGNPGYACLLPAP